VKAETEERVAEDLGVDFEKKLRCDGLLWKKNGSPKVCGKRAKTRVTTRCCTVRTTLNCRNCLLELEIRGYICIHCDNHRRGMEVSDL